MSATFEISTAISLSAPSSCAYGSVTLSASLSTTGGVPVSGKTLLLQSSPNNTTWSTLKSFPSGTSKMAISAAPTTATYYRVAFSGDATYTASTSRVVKTTPKAYLTSARASRLELPPLPALRNHQTDPLLVQGSSHISLAPSLGQAETAILYVLSGLGIHLQLEVHVPLHRQVADPDRAPGRLTQRENGVWLHCLLREVTERAKSSAPLGQRRWAAATGVLGASGPSMNAGQRPISIVGQLRGQRAPHPFG